MSSSQQSLLATGIPQVVTLPAGSVLIKLQASDPGAPTGFTYLTTVTGGPAGPGPVTSRAISGTTTNPQGRTGSPAPMTFSAVGSNPSGAHSMGPTVSMQNDGTPAANRAAAESAGSHNHTISWSPPGFTVPSAIRHIGIAAPLITNAADVTKIPAGCIVWSVSATNFSNCSSFTAASSPFGPFPPYGIFQTPTGPNTSSSISSPNSAPILGPLISPLITNSAQGTHNHSSVNQGTIGPTGPAGIPQLAPPAPTAHSHAGPHPSDGQIFKSFYHMRPQITTAAADVQTGMIVATLLSSAPSGWFVCNGSNGTPNLNGALIGYADSIPTSGPFRFVGQDAIGPPTFFVPLLPISPPGSGVFLAGDFMNLNPFAWPHAHLGNPPVPVPIRSTNKRNAIHQSASHPHGHIISGSSVFFPTNYGLDSVAFIFIMKG